jgi:hypothetical protein
MKDVVRTQGLGLLILKVLAVGSALTFLAVVMVNACATHPAHTQGAPSPGVPIYAAPTKAAPVFHPAPVRAAPQPLPADDEDELRAPATKAAPVFQPRRRAPAAPQQQAAPPQQAGAGAP